jgi:ribose transport system permease protein
MTHTPDVLAPSPIRVPTPSWPTKLHAAATRNVMSTIFVLMFAVLCVASPKFRDPQNLVNILQQNSVIGIVACGMLVVIIAAGFDLSVGAVAAAAACLGAQMMVDHSIFAGIVAALLVGAVGGVFNGVLVARVGITPFVATLGSSVLFTGLLLSYTDAKSIVGIPSGLGEFVNGRSLGIPHSVLLFAIVATVVWAFLRLTAWGHFTYAIGSSREASRLAGLPVAAVVTFGFVLTGVLSAVAGLILLGQTAVGAPTAGASWALTAIAAVVVGGTPLRGGSGGIFAPIIGTLLLGVLSNALTLYGVSPYLQPTVTGIVILLAVGIDSLNSTRKKVHA